MMKKYIHHLIAFLILITSTGYANAGLLFNVSGSSNDLTINTTIPNHTYSYAGIKITSTGYTLTDKGSECTELPNGYCLFSVSQTTSKTLSISGSGASIDMILCLDGRGPLSCQNYQVVPSPSLLSYIFVVNNNSNSISLCRVNTNGTLSHCITVGTGLIAPFGIAINNTGTMIYITNGGSNNIAMCSVNATTKVLTCTNYNQVGVFDLPVGITLNPTNTFIYITNYNNDTVAICSLSGDTITACVDSGQLFFGGLEGIAIDPSNTYAYIVQNSADAIYKCTINPVNGRFTACVDSGATGTPFDEPEFITLNSAGTMAYITNDGGGSFILRCPIDNAGNLGICVNVNPGVDFAGPKQIVFNSTGTQAYVANTDTNTIFSCTVDINGNFSSCMDSGAIGFNGPWGIIIT